MKIAIISDCHFGFNEDALPQAREAMLRALQMQADAILLPGDIYDVRVPKPETLHETINLYREVRERGSGEGREQGIKVMEMKGGKEHPISLGGIPILAIWGTHERRSKGLTNVIQIMASAELLINFHARTIVLEKGRERVALQGLGGVPEEYFGRTLEVAEFHPLKDAFNIFVFHQNLRELMPVELEGCVGIGELPAGFQLYVNGHIHWNHDLTIQGRRLLVAGSTVVTQMKKNEEKPKGFYLFDTQTGRAEFVHIESRPFRFLEMEFGAETAEEMEKAIGGKLKEAIRDAGAKTPLIKLKLSGSISRLAAHSLKLEPLIKKYSAEAMIFVDKEFESGELKEKIGLLRKLRADGKGAKEMGLEILKAKLKEQGVQLKDADELFELLAEGEIEGALANV